MLNVDALLFQQTLRLTHKHETSQKNIWNKQTLQLILPEFS